MTNDQKPWPVHATSPQTDQAYRISYFSEHSDVGREIVRCDMNGAVTIGEDADRLIAEMLASVHQRERAIAWQARAIVDGARMPGIVNAACVDMSRMADELAALAMRLRETEGQNPLTADQIAGQVSDDIGAIAVQLVSRCHEALSKARLLPDPVKTPPEVDRSRGVVSPMVRP